MSRRPGAPRGQRHARAQSARLRQLRRDSRWYAGWLKRLCDRYDLPLFQLEQMPLGSFHREIATLLADTIVREAQRISAKVSDQKERRKLNAEYAKLKKSDDWFDRLVVEKIES
jgi:hypothetical protein